MGKFLMKSPLTAVIFAALWYFAAVFMPVSQSYSDSLAVFKMPLLGYVFMIVYGLWISIIAALVIGETKSKGAKPVLLTLLAFLLTQWFTPMIQQVWFGEVTGVMARSDLWFKMASGAAATLFLMILLLLLFKHPAETPHVGAPLHAHDKFKMKKLHFAIKLIVLPIIYCIVYFLAWYFLLRRVEAARVYYYGSSDHSTFVKELINIILLNDVRQVWMSLIKGFAYAIGILPLLFLLPAKRAMFIVASVMLLFGPALQMLIPSPVMDSAVRMAHLAELSADAVVYGGLTGIMFHTSLHKLETKPPAAPPPANAARSKQPDEQK